MLNQFKQLLSENGDLSMTRFLSLICVVTASVIALLSIYTTKHSLESVALLCGTFLGAGLGAKVMQKKFEVSEAPPKSNSETSSSQALSHSEKES